MLAAGPAAGQEGPKFRNVNIFPEERSALVTWSTDEISRDTVFLLDAPGGKVLQTVPAAGWPATSRSTFAGLTPNTTYYIYFAGDGRAPQRTPSTRTTAEYWKFTTKASAVAAQHHRRAGLQRDP